MKQYQYLYLCLFAVLFSSCLQKKANEKVIRTVKTDTVRIYDESQKVVYPGKVVASSDANLSFRIAGPIVKVNVDVGSFVRKGQTLAEMDVRDYEIQLHATEAEYKQIKAEAERIIALHEKGSVSSNNYDKAVYGLKQITAKYDAHKNALVDTKLLAPFDGYVQKRYFNAGETVGAGTPVISMINAGVPEVEINIPSSEYIRHNRFDSFFCETDVFPDTVFPLDLIGIAQKANMNQLYTVRLKMKNGEKQLPSPGMVAMVTIQYHSEKSDRVYIPYSALFEINATPSVWVYHADNETVSAQTVKPSELRTDGTVVISEGLTAGEIVITAGIHSLKEGEKVKVLAPMSKTNVGGLL